MEVFSCENGLYVKSLPFSTITFLILSFWIIRAWETHKEIYIRLIWWMGWPIEQTSEICYC